jgi:hypothetical protein
VLAFAGLRRPPARGPMRSGYGASFRWTAGLRRPPARGPVRSAYGASFAGAGLRRPPARGPVRSGYGAGEDALQATLNAPVVRLRTWTGGVEPQ